MHILMLIDVFSFAPASGAGTVFFEQARRLAGRGHRVSAICRRRADLPADGLVEGVRFLTYPSGRGTAIRLWKANRSLFRKLWREQPVDLVCTHHPLPFYALRSLLEENRVPVVYVYHSPWAEEYRLQRGAVPWIPHRWGGYHLRARIERSALAAADRVVTLSDYMREEVVRRCGGASVHRIPGGVDGERFVPQPDRRQARRALGWPEDRWIVLTVRRQIPRMGLEDLLDAVSMASAQIPDIHLVVGGVGPSSELLRCRARALVLGERIRFMGFVPQQQLPSCYGAADLVAVPSRRLEGFGLVILEAMACGTPVVATPVGGMPELLRPFDPACLCEGVGSRPLADRLVFLGRSRGIVSGWAARARGYALEHFSWDRSIDKLERLCFDMVSSSEA
jgi:glycosyltransferase involved in cell wall biosynthesis